MIHGDMAKYVSGDLHMIGKLKEFSFKSFSAEKLSHYLVAISVGAFAIIAHEKKFVWSPSNAALVQKRQSQNPASLLVYKAHYLLRDMFGSFQGDKKTPRINLARKAWTEFFLAAGYDPKAASEAGNEKVVGEKEKGVATFRLGLRLLLSEKVCQ